MFGKTTSRPVRARGLKRGIGDPDLPVPLSRPVRARGLKLLLLSKTDVSCASRPVRARGLKRRIGDLSIDRGLSRPVRARGLKQYSGDRPDAAFDVAPRAGAWIETIS